MLSTYISSHLIISQALIASADSFRAGLECTVTCRTSQPASCRGLGPCLKHAALSSCLDRCDQLPYHKPSLPYIGMRNTPSESRRLDIGRATREHDMGRGHRVRSSRHPQRGSTPSFEGRSSPLRMMRERGFLGLQPPLEGTEAKPCTVRRCSQGCYARDARRDGC